MKCDSKKSPNLKYWTLKLVKLVVAITVPPPACVWVSCQLRCLADSTGGLSLSWPCLRLSARPDLARNCLMKHSPELRRHGQLTLDSRPPDKIPGYVEKPKQLVIFYCYVTLIFMSWYLLVIAIIFKFPVNCTVQYTHALANIRFCPRVHNWSHLHRDCMTARDWLTRHDPGSASDSRGPFSVLLSTKNWLRIHPKQFSGGARGGGALTVDSKALKSSRIG